MDVANIEAVEAVVVTPRAEPKAKLRSRINLVLFSGGSGTKSITEAMLKHPQIALKILINAYDDGHSTGRLRRFIPGMLGPSDVRKNINRLMPVEERSQCATGPLRSSPAGRHSAWRCPGDDRGDPGGRHRNPRSALGAL